MFISLFIPTECLLSYPGIIVYASFPTPMKKEIKKSAKSKKELKKSARFHLELGGDCGLDPSKTNHP
jgi:hypothetical protein